MNGYLKFNRSPGVFFGFAAALLLVAMWQSKPFGNYSFFGALLLIPAVIFSAAGILTSSGQKMSASDESYRALLLTIVCAAMLEHAVTSVSMLRHLPGTDTDVYLFQQHSAEALLHGIDPYTLTTENLYGSTTTFYGPHVLENGRVQIGLPYPPVSLFFVLPAYVLGDIRYAYVLAVLSSAAIIVSLRTNWVTAGIACWLLLSPVTLLVELRSWTEPFVLLALSVTIYAALRKCWWLPIALGVFLASKQYSALALPFVPLLLAERRWKPVLTLLVRALGVAIVLTLPMAIWNLHGFWRDIVLLHIRQPFREDALTLGNLFFPIPVVVILMLVITGTTFALRKAKPHPSMFAACYGFTLLIFVCTNKQAFCNYYFLIVQALLLAVGTLSVPLPHDSPSASQHYRIRVQLAEPVVNSKFREVAQS